MKKLTLKEILSIVLVLILVIVASYFGVKKNSEKLSTIDTPTQQIATSTLPNGWIPLALDVLYANTQYGFNLSLPESWKNYSVKVQPENVYSPDAFTADSAGDAVQPSQPNVKKGSKPIAQIPIVYIIDTDHSIDVGGRDREFPVEVFTIKQWNALNTEKSDGIFVPDLFNSPAKRNELGRNDKYVFAMSTRVIFCWVNDVGECSQILATFKTF